MRRLLLIAVLLLPGLLFSAATITAVRAYDVGPYVRVIIDLDQPTSHHSFSLDHPDRYVIDVDNVKLAPHVGLPTFLNVAWIKTMRKGPRGQSGLRFVLDLTEQVTVKTSKTRTASGGEQLIADFYVNKAQEVVKAVGDTDHGLRDVRVVIDPGHGGKDSGAIGHEKTYEKEVVLAIGKFLQGYIDQAPGMKAYMTRSSDRFVSLRGRLAIARKDDADLFVAIHADNFRDPSVRGATVFALSDRGATSEAARWLAKNSNVELMGGVELSDKSRSLQSLLLDLSQTATINRSLILGNYVLRDLDQISQLHHHHVDQARFVVLKSPDIPSILVETGFLSNHFEEQRLRQSWYQKKVAYAIFKGIKQYIYENPPPNTKILSWVREASTKYVVKRGDTLSKIAQEFNVSVSHLQQKNALKSTNVYVGQKLTI